MPDIAVYVLLFFSGQAAISHEFIGKASCINAGETLAGPVQERLSAHATWVCVPRHLMANP